jgi:hypothetical protein
MDRARHRDRRASAQEKLLAEEQAFHRKRAQLQKRYKGEFVVLYRGRVVAHGKDDEDLARRMFERVGDEPFYIAHVDGALLVYDLPSPETAGMG